MDRYKKSNLTKMDKTIDSIVASLGELDNIKKYGDGTVSSAIIDTRKYIDTKISTLIGTVPETLDTLEEIAGVLEDHHDVMDTLNNIMSTKFDKVGGTISGNVNITGSATVKTQLNVGNAVIQSDGNIYMPCLGNKWLGNIINSMNSTISTKQPNLGFTPVQQGGGTGQSTNKVYIGWNGSRLLATVDKINLGGIVFDSHLSSYIPVSGHGSLSGSLTFNGNNLGISGYMADSDCWRIIGVRSANDSGYLEIATADNGTEPIIVRQYAGNGVNFNGTITNEARLLDYDGSTMFPKILYVGYGKEYEERRVQVQNALHAGQIGVSSSGNFGLYSRTCSKWILRCDTAGNIHMDRLHITSIKDVDMNSTLHGLTIGKSEIDSNGNGGQHLAIDNNGIMARATANYVDGDGVTHSNTWWTDNGDVTRTFAPINLILQGEAGDVTIGPNINKSRKNPSRPWRINLKTDTYCIGCMNISGLLVANGGINTNEIAANSVQAHTIVGNVTDTSDENVKTITKIDERYERFFNLIEPVIYSLKYESDDKHIGFGARAVEQALLKSGLTLEDFSGVIKTPNHTYKYKDKETGEDKSIEFDEFYTIAYKEFIGLHDHMIKKNQNRINKLEEENSVLISKVQSLEGVISNILERLSRFENMNN